MGNQNNERRYHFLSLKAMIRLSDWMWMTGDVVITPMKQITLLARATTLCCREVHEFTVSIGWRSLVSMETRGWPEPICSS